jgi:hypothetical protein
MSLQARFQSIISGPYTRPAGLGQKLYTLNYSYDRSLADGTIIQAADLAYVGLSISIAASGTLDIDLTNPATLDALGDPLALVRVKAVKVVASSANTNDVLVGNAPSNTWLGWWGAAGHYSKVPPDGMLFHTHPGFGSNNGWTVTAGTGDILRIANGGAGTPVVFDILIIGASA